MDKDMFEKFGLDGKAGREIGQAMMEYAELERDFLMKALELVQELPKENPITNPFEEE